MSPCSPNFKSGLFHLFSRQVQSLELTASRHWSRDFMEDLEIHLEVIIDLMTVLATQSPKLNLERLPNSTYLDSQPDLLDPRLRVEKRYYHS